VPISNIACVFLCGCVISSPQQPRRTAAAESFKYRPLAAASSTLCTTYVLTLLSQRCVLSSSSTTAYSWIDGPPLFDAPVPPPSSAPRQFPDDAAAAAAVAAAAALQWTDSVSFIADIDVRRLRLRPMAAVQGEEVHALYIFVLFEQSRELV
jgi:hypothetical protein